MPEHITMNNLAKSHEKEILEAMTQVLDPDIGLDIINLGLVYEIHLDAAKHLDIVMTFTSKGCTCVVSVPQEIKDTLNQLDFIDSVSVETIWEPAWSPLRITRVGRITLGIRV